MTKIFKEIHCTPSIKLIVLTLRFLGTSPVKVVYTKNDVEITTAVNKKYLIKNCLLTLIMFFIHWQGIVLCPAKDGHLGEHIMVAATTLQIICTFVRLFLFTKHHRQIVKICNQIQSLLQELPNAFLQSYQRLHLVEATGLISICIFYCISYNFPSPTSCHGTWMLVLRSLSFFMLTITDYAAAVICFNVIYMQKVGFRNLWMESLDRITLEKFHSIWRKYLFLLKLNKTGNKVYGFSVLSLFINYYIVVMNTNYITYYMAKYYTGFHVYRRLIIITAVFRLFSVTVIVNQISQCILYFSKVRCRLSFFDNEGAHLREVKKVTIFVGYLNIFLLADKLHSI